MSWWVAVELSYVVTAIPLLGHAALQLDLLRCARRTQDRPAPPLPEPSTPAPLVAVQLPVYNEPAVIHRLLDACARLDHPPESLVIQVLDDSTDVTTELIDDWLARHAGVPRVEHVRRGSRDGFKAGALQHGLELLPGAEFVLILDADFVPPRDLLRQTLPRLLDDPAVAGAQTLWGHINRDVSWLTRAQATMLDNHFVIEQGGRSALGGFMAFNGSGGLLRVSAIRDVGGWSARTLTEDFDLSVRLQLVGHRLVLVPEVRSGAELPATVSALRGQQHRWMRGVAQNSRTFLRRAWRHPMTLRRRLHLLGQLLETGAFVAWGAQVLLAPVIAWGFATGHVRWPVAANLPLAATFVLLLPVYGAALGRDAAGGARAVRDGVRAYAEFLVLSGGLALANAVAVVWGWLGSEATFVRTPKWGRPGESAWAPVPDEAVGRRRWPSHVVVEVCLVTLAAGGAVLVLLQQPIGAFALWPQVTGWAGLAAFAWTARPRVSGAARRSSPVGVSGSPEGAA